MGASKLLGGGAKKGPSPQEIQAQQEAAARAERDRLAQEKAGAEAATAKQMQDNPTQARILAAGILPEETGRKRFLKGL